jgi:hypothetical protein
MYNVISQQTAMSVKHSRNPHSSTLYDCSRKLQKCFVGTYTLSYREFRIQCQKHVSQQVSSECLECDKHLTFVTECSSLSLPFPSKMPSPKADASETQSPEQQYELPQCPSQTIELENDKGQATSQQLPTSRSHCRLPKTAVNIKKGHTWLTFLLCDMCFHD